MSKTLSLQDVQQSFERWRLKKAYRCEKAPGVLREQVRTLASYHSRETIINALSLTSVQYERYVLKRTSGHRCAEESSINFAELSRKTLGLSGLFSTPSATLELSRTDGTRLFVESATLSIVSQAMDLFFREA